MKDELLTIDENGVTCVVSTLLPRNYRKRRSEKVDDLTLSLIAPLCTDDSHVHRRHCFPKLKLEIIAEQPSPTIYKPAATSLSDKLLH